MSETTILAFLLVGIALFAVVAMIWLVKDETPRMALVWVACISAICGSFVAVIDAADDGGRRGGAMELRD
jgi:hypothetical protein